MATSILPSGANSTIQPAHISASMPTPEPASPHSCACERSSKDGTQHAGTSFQPHVSPEKCLEYQASKVAAVWKRFFGEGVEDRDENEDKPQTCSRFSSGVSLTPYPESRIIRYDIHGTMHSLKSDSEEGVSWEREHEREQYVAETDKSLIITAWVNSGKPIPLVNLFEEEVGGEGSAGTFRMFDGRMQLRGEMNAPEIPPENWGMEIDREGLGVVEGARGRLV